MIFSIFYLTIKKNGLALLDDDEKFIKKKLLYKNRKQILIINNLTKEDSNDYFCMAMNRFGKIARHINLTVIYMSDEVLNISVAMDTYPYIIITVASTIVTIFFILLYYYKIKKRRKVSENMVQ